LAESDAGNKKATDGAVAEDLKFYFNAGMKRW
jgi:hypothetical protein